MIELFTGDALESVRDFKIWEHCADGIHAYRARMDCWSPVPLITTSQSVSERDSMLRPLCVLGCRGRERKRTGLKKNRRRLWFKAVAFWRQNGSGAANGKSGSGLPESPPQP